MSSLLNSGGEGEGTVNDGAGGAPESGTNEGSASGSDNGLNNGSGDGSEDGSNNHWSSSLPDDLGTVKVKGEDGVETEINIREHPILQKYGSVNDAVKGLVHAQSLIGKKGGASIPGEDASDEDRAKFWNELGKPEAADGYKLDGVQLPEGVQIKNDDTLKSIMAFAHENDFTQQHFEAGLQLLGAMYADEQAGKEAAAAVEKEEKIAEAKKTMESEWKNETGANYNLCKKAALAIGGQELLDAMDSTGFGNNPAMLRGMLKVYGMVGEDSLKGGGGMPEVTYSRAQLESMQADPRYADPEKRDPEFVATVRNGWKALLAKEERENEQDI